MRIISREEWGARYDRGFHNRALPVSEEWLHHSVTIAPDLLPPFDDDYAAVRTLENIGESRFGGGISYTFAITPVGLIFEGHGVETSGAHTLGRNDIASAICWIGNYATAAPTEAMIRATAWLLVHGKRQGWWRQARLSGGHGQAPGQSTDCPGGKARAAIARVNELAAQFEAGAISLDGTNQEEDDLMSQHIELPPTGKDADGNDVVREYVVALPWQGGAGGVTGVSAAICNGNAPMSIRVAHWQVVEDGKQYPVAMVPDGTSLEGLRDTGGRRAPANTRSLVIDYVAPLGGAVVVEAWR